MPVTDTRPPNSGQATRSSRVLPIILFLLLLPGCVSSLAGAALLDPDDVGEMVTLMKESGMNGCTWLRGRGNPPGGEVNLDMIFAYGEINSLECLKTIEGRSGQ